MLRPWRSTCPPRRFSKAELVWVAFVVVQALDGAMSYIGVHTFGAWIEANPLVAWYAAIVWSRRGLYGGQALRDCVRHDAYLMARHRRSPH